MVRTFIGVELTTGLQSDLGEVIEALRPYAPRVQWSKTENLHITLKFIGSIMESDLDALFAVQESVARCISGFDLDIGGIGAFPHWRHPRVVWAGCGDGAEELTDLAEAVDAAVSNVGYDPERRPFRPHITLGRVKLPADVENGLAPAADTYRHTVFGYIEVQAITVFLSQLRRTGPIYAPMARFPLTK